MKTQLQPYFYFIFIVFSLFFIHPTTKAQQDNTVLIEKLKTQINEKAKTYYQVQNLNLIAKKYIENEKYKEAKTYLLKAEKLATELNYLQGLSESYTYLGLTKAYYDERPDEAFVYHEKAYRIYKQLFETEKIKEEQMLDFLNNYAIDLYENIKAKDSKKRRYKKAIDNFQKLQSEFKEYIALIASKKELAEKEKTLKEKESTIKAKESTIKEKETTIGSKVNELISKQLSLKNEILAKAKITGKLEASELEKMRLQDSIVGRNLQLSIQEIDNQKLLKEKAIKEKEAEVHKAKATQTQLWLFIFAVSIFLLIILVLFIIIWLRNQRKANSLLQQKNKEIELKAEEIQQQAEEILAQRDALEEKSEVLIQEQQKSEALLSNILPPHVIHELKENGAVTPSYHSQVSVIFTDFKGFTKMAANMTAEEVVTELTTCFEKFDEIMEKYDLDKIKTIGDGYMAAGGFFNSKKQANNAVEACLDMLAFMEEWKKQKMEQQKPIFEVRIGIHTGGVVAGVIGKKKFAYDIWGDTVNLASRMESSGEAGKLNISESTYNIIKDNFECTPRGMIEAKNAGEMQMFFVERKKD
ncbi:MAG: hypothetical protein EAZ85_05830 [Bacteroidetes bacterium]|nr:MAG: hypothetical protein EAZ85_05830 [Bacteroidota bacterium]TAG86251.1 MAG: hypothetical protein EAZ20_13155 [Bacteroidota bacterium]